MRKFLMGNEAIALGALRAGVRVVTGYPGTPSSEVLETAAKYNDGRVYIEWSVNEKAALEVAAGAAYAGARSMVTMKQVGLNVASDPLMSLNYVGVKGGMVIVVADDPGPISSQTEQDTRRFAQFAKLAVFDPSSPEEAYTMIADAFDFSEKYGAPVLLRPTTRVCHGCADVELLDALPIEEPEGFVKDSRFVIFPKLSYQNHIKIEKNLIAMSEELSGYDKNILTGSGNKGIAAGGISYPYVREALQTLGADCKLLKISAFPFPEQKGLQFLTGLDEVLCVEELDPVIEDALTALCGKHHLKADIKGKRTGHLPNAGENTVEGVTEAVAAFLGIVRDAQHVLPSLPAPPVPPPARPPLLCAGCSHRGSFFAVKEAVKGKKAVFSGDIGCYTLGNAQPLDMVDTCLCMGAGITIAQGLQRVEPDTLHFAFVGDSTFFHTGIPGILNAVYNQTDIIVVILDNGTTAMTGGQPHPGTGRTMMGRQTKPVSIYDVVSALGVQTIVRADPLDAKAAKEAVLSVTDKKGVRVILFESPCNTLKKQKPPLTVNAEVCTGCKLCISKLGCPAIAFENGKAAIDITICNGCGLCAAVCLKGAIGRDAV